VKTSLNYGSNPATEQSLALYQIYIGSEFWPSLKTLLNCRDKEISDVGTGLITKYGA